MNLTEGADLVTIPFPFCHFSPSRLLSLSRLFFAALASTTGREPVAR